MRRRSRIHRVRWGHLAPASLVTLFLVACSPGADEPTATPATTAEPTSPTAPASTATASGSPTPTQTITTKPVKGIGGGDLVLEIYALRESEDLVVLDFGMKNDWKQRFGVGTRLSRDGETGDVSGVYLHDVAGRTKYYPAKAGGECVCSAGLDRTGVRPGNTQSFSATFGKLPPDVTKVDVVVPTVGAFEKVSVER